MEQDKRRYPRTSVALDVTVAATGSSWKGRTLNLSPYGVKVSSPAEAVSLRPGTTVKLWLHPADEGPALALPASVVRTDPDGLALTFGTLEAQQSRRLKSLVDTLLLGEWQELLNNLGSGEPSNLPTGTAAQPSGTPEVPEGTRPAENGGRLGARAPRPEPLEMADPAKPEAELVSNAGADQDGLQQLLARVGLDSLSLPSNGVLSRQWRDFLNQCGAAKGRRDKPKTERSKG